MKINTWKDAKKVILIRSSPCGLYPNTPLDKGVNYFILALEKKLKCVTYYSCEGHFTKNHYVPELYIVFNTKPETALKIKKMIPKKIGSVEDEYKNTWSIRIPFLNAKDKIKKLTYLSNKWNKILGDIEYDERI